ANLDNSTQFPFGLGKPTIQNNEIAGTGKENVWYGTFALELVYRLMGEVATTTLERRAIFGRTLHFYVKEHPTSGFQLNDFLVTINSSKLPGFAEIPAVKANHATIARRDVGVTVINRIRSAQPIR
ncbi:MAG: hypothetical protein ACRD68_07060, partial [Pyrinomonadaceae bacterium]